MYLFRMFILHKSTLININGNILHLRKNNLTDKLKMLKLKRRASGYRFAVQ